MDRSEETFTPVTDEQRASNEREQVAEVFGLTGGELEANAWVPTYVHNEQRPAPFTFTYWYQGVPEYVEREFDALPLAYAPTYRTVCRDEMSGDVPEQVTDDEGTWRVVARYRSSGETECPYRNDDNPPVPTKENPCPLCDADGSPAWQSPSATDAGEHGYIYIGDGWAEVVYRLEPQADAETLDRVDSVVFALNELLLNDREKLTDSERDLIDAADLAVNQVQDAIRTRLGLTDSAGNDI